jgi:hypothetical protein
MSKITITQDGIDFDISETGCHVVPDTVGSVNLTWAQLNDVEQLSEAFTDYTVGMFKRIVIVLGKIQANKAAYESML